MSVTVKEGMYGTLSIGGSAVAALSEVSFKASRAAKDWVPMGTPDANQILLGAETFKLTAKRGYIDNTYLAMIRSGTVLAGTFYPRGGTSPYCAGSLVCTDSGVSGVKQGSADPVLEDLTFSMYAVTYT